MLRCWGFASMQHQAWRTQKGQDPKTLDKNSKMPADWIGPDETGWDATVPTCFVGEIESKAQGFRVKSAVEETTTHLGGVAT